MSILTDTRDYEAWLRKQCDVVKTDVEYKHYRMHKNAFVFLRATYYRWARKIEDWCPELRKAPSVLAIGDLHTENFGTWRDDDGRLVWGVNDFDEAAEMPYPLDLVRLAVSAVLAPRQRLKPRDICRAILSGYRAGLKKPGPQLLDENVTWMLPLVGCTEGESEEFWDEVRHYPDKDPPRKVAAGLKRSLPRHAKIVRFCMRTTGGGSLGRPRHVALACWDGGQVVREAKAHVASAWDWAHKRKPDRSVFLRVARGRHRSPDPLLDSHGHFIYRRIAPDARKIELDDDDHEGEWLTTRLLYAMGRELGSIHAALPKRVKDIERDLSKRRSGWLVRATEKVAAKVQEDHKTWCEKGPAGRKRKKSRKLPAVDCAS